MCLTPAPPFFTRNRPLASLVSFCAESTASNVENQCWAGSESRTAAAYNQGACLGGWGWSRTWLAKRAFPTLSSPSQGVTCLRTDPRREEQCVSSPGRTHRGAVTFHNQELCRPNCSPQGILKYRILHFVIHFGSSAFLPHQSVLPSLGPAGKASPPGVAGSPLITATRWGWSGYCSGQEGMWAQRAAGLEGLW